MIKNEKLRIYIGFKENRKAEIFETQNKPSKETHPQFDFIYGPFKSIEAAKKYINAMGGLACGDG